MSVSDQTQKSLEKIGLTGYEIKTFTSLLKTGELTASDLSKQSGVPYSKIYEVLGILEEKGWIGSDKSRPTKYFAKSPNSALQTTKQKLEEDFAKNEKTILNDLNPIYKKSGTAEKPDIWVITGTMNIATRILEMIDTCREEVLIAIVLLSPILSDVILRLLPTAVIVAPVILMPLIASDVVWISVVIAIVCSDPPSTVIKRFSLAEEKLLAVNEAPV